MNPSNVAVRSYAAYDSKSELKAFQFERRNPGAFDVQIDILYCGVCHSDLHFIKGDWGKITYPLVPGHEIVGKVEQVGTEVKKFKVGDVVGVGCLVDSCRTCPSCKEGLEQYCETGMTMTYGSAASNEPTGITHGGYSTKIVVDENYLLRIPSTIPLKNAAPLLCAGITTYSPLRYWKVGSGDRIGVVGLGGLGHMAVKLARAMGAEVTVFSTSENKRNDAMKLGAHHFVVSNDRVEMEKRQTSLTLIIDTVSASHDYNLYLGLLKREGTMVLLGLPEPTVVAAVPLVFKRRSLAGSLIGGIRETQEMLDFCAKHEIAADVEVIPMQEINKAYERMLKGDVHYRFVIDLQSLK
ncbi:MAG: NAD(P)-dependent alcohol dehydrogenase [Oligoflexia bacterium]|nr:NAD(P)-dependent alcohol dehydrogenase [Oligoflexia bacterium]